MLSKRERPVYPEKMGLSFPGNHMERPPVLLNVMYNVDYSSKISSSSLNSVRGRAQAEIELKLSSESLLINPFCVMAGQPKEMIHY